MLHALEAGFATQVKRREERIKRAVVHVVKGYSYGLKRTLIYFLNFSAKIVNIAVVI